MDNFLSSPLAPHPPPLPVPRGSVKLMSCHGKRQTNEGKKLSSQTWHLSAPSFTTRWSSRRIAENTRDPTRKLLRAEGPWSLDHVDG